MRQFFSRLSIMWTPFEKITKNKIRFKLCNIEYKLIFNGICHRN